MAPSKNQGPDWEFIVFVLCGTAIVITMLVCGVISPEAFK